MTAWNYANVWETVAETVPDATALVHGARRLTWREFDERADSLARHFLDSGFGRQGKVAQYLFNGPEYLESLYAAFKAGLVPVNTNYRYGVEELTSLWRMADVDAVVFHGRFTETAAAVRAGECRIRGWVHVDDGTDPCPDWATPYEDAVAARAGRVVPAWGRSPDDLYLLVTGGTTGRPKGVMWRQDDLFARMNTGALVRYPEDGGVDDVRRVLGEQSGPVHLPASPLMHGTGAITSMSSLAQGGRVVTLTKPSFDAVELLDAIHRERVNTVVIVGNMFARPIVEALDREPGRWDITSLRYVMSSGALWSAESQAGLLRHHPRLMIVDALGSSEAIGIGRAIRQSGDGDGTIRFDKPETTKVLGPDDRDVVPGSGEIGRVAVRGRLPLGYYRDPDATARTFPVIDGVRHAVSGDFATVEADGTMRLLGRGSQCINTGGEKVFAEEVEEAVRTHPDVADVVVLGVPDPTWGETVCAVVQPESGAVLEPAMIIEHVKARLAGYKAPKVVLFMDTIGRGANGKVDLPALREMALLAPRAGSRS